MNAGRHDDGHCGVEHQQRPQHPSMEKLSSHARPSLEGAVVHQTSDHSKSEGDNRAPSQWKTTSACSPNDVGVRLCYRHPQPHHRFPTRQRAAHYMEQAVDLPREPMKQATGWLQATCSGARGLESVPHTCEAASFHRPSLPPSQQPQDNNQVCQLPPRALLSHPQEHPGRLLACRETGRRLAVPART